VARNDREALLDWRRRAPHAHRAHPTDDHFLPLFFTLGAAGWGGDTAPGVDWISREVMYGMLAMDAFALPGA
jgi:4,5-DOPA dioxygenase extradiol